MPVLLPISNVLQKTVSLAMQVSADAQTVPNVSKNVIIVAIARRRQNLLFRSVISANSSGTTGTHK
jgi:hypothetical protein